MKKHNVQQRKKEKKPMKKSIRELLPIVAYDTEVEAYLLEDQTYLDLIQMKTKDLIEISPEEEQFDKLRIEKFYRIFGGDLKLITMNFPCDTREQIAYFEHKQVRTKNELHKKWLDLKQRELIWLQQNKTGREYYMMYFAATKEELEKTRKTFKAILDNGEALMEKLPAEKKHQICRKLNNKNCAVG